LNYVQLETISIVLKTFLYKDNFLSVTFVSSRMTCYSYSMNNRQK